MPTVLASMTAASGSNFFDGGSECLAFIGVASIAAVQRLYSAVASMAGYPRWRVPGNWLAKRVKTTSEPFLAGLHRRHGCGLLEANAVKHLLDLDLVHTHGADRDQLAFEAAARHGPQRWVVCAHPLGGRPLVIAVRKVVLRRWAS